MAALGQALAPAPRIPVRPTAPRGPDIAFDRTQNKLFVQGTVFDADDADSALRAEELLDGPGTGLPTTGNWEPLDVGAYQQYLSSIKNPSMGRLASKSFGRGVDQLQMLGGSALQLLGAEELGGRIVSAQEEQLRKTSPFERQFTDIGSSPERGVMDWFVANLATQGPNILESIAAGLAGAAVGSVTASPGIGTAGGFLAGVFGKKALKEKIIDAAGKYRRGEIKKGDNEFEILANASALAGATAATFGSSYAMGIGDIYGEMRDQGVTADDTGARLTALLGGFPYAAAESMSEFVLARRILGFGGKPRAIPEGVGVLRRGGELLRRGAVGAAIGAPMEGLTEVSQEALAMGLSGQDLTSDEAINRFINSFAAGAAIGGGMGGLANLKSPAREEANLLTNPPPPPPPAPLPPGQLELPLEGGVAAPTPTSFAPTTEGTQGVLDVGVPGQPMTAEEALYRGRPVDRSVAPVEEVAPEQMDLFAAPEQVQRQIVMQFAPPAPEGIGFTEQQGGPPNAIQLAMQKAQRQRAFDQREAELAGQRNREMDQLQTGGAAQRTAQQELAYLAEQEALQQELEQEQALAEAPQRTFGPRQAEQLRLPLRTPRTSLREALRRGTSALPVSRLSPDAPPGTQGSLFPASLFREENQVGDLGRAPTQLSLFTQKGEPTVAAMKGAGPKTKVVDPQDVAAQAKADADAAKAAAKKKAAEDKLKKGEAAKKKAAGKGEKLKKQKVETAGEKATRLYAADVNEEYMKLTDSQRAAVAADLNLSQEQVRAQIDAPTQEQIEKIDDAITTAKKTVETTTETDTTTEVDASTFTMLGATEADIRIVEATEVGTAQREDAMAILADTAFLLGEESNVKAAADRARTFINTTQLYEADREVVDGVIIDGINTLTSKQGFYPASDKVRGGTMKPWLAWAYSRGLLPSINTQITAMPYDTALAWVRDKVIRLDNLPTSIRKQVAKALDIEIAADTPTVPDTISNAGKTLANEIKNINARTTETPANQVKKLREKLTTLYAAAQAQNLTNYLVDNGSPIEDYFTATGQPIINVINKRVVVGTEKLTPAQIVAASKTERADRIMAASEADIQQDTLTLADWNVTTTDTFSDDYSGDYYRDNGAPITKPVSLGKIQLLVKSFLSKLKIKPKVHIYKNQADLRERNPSLYDRAKAARPQNDFDTAPAVGYSFGKGEVLIFSDRVATEKQLKFVLAHETLGHFGFRGMIGATELNRILDDIYAQSQKVRSGVDAYMAAFPDMDKREATEEYLADYAGSLDTNILARFWNAVKNLLNKIGVTFDDDIARYLVNQSRQYVRYGMLDGRPVDMGQIGRNIMSFESMQDPYGSGRYSLGGPYADDTNRVAVERVSSPLGYEKFTTLRGVLAAAEKKKINVGSFLERMRSELSLMNWEARRNQGYRAVYLALQNTVRRSSQLRSKYNDMMRDVLRPSVEIFGSKFSKGATQGELDTVNTMLNATSSARHGMATDKTLNKLGDLVVMVNGEPVVVDDVLTKLKALGRVTIDQFRSGFEYERTVNRPMTPERRAELEAEMKIALAAESDPKAKKAIEREYKAILENPNAEFKVTEKVAAMPGLKEDDLVWKMYTQVRDTMDEAALDSLLADYKAAIGEQIRVASTASILLNRVLSDMEKAYLDRVTQKYLELGEAAVSVNDDGSVSVNKELSDKANEFIAKWNESLLADRSDKYVALKEFLNDAEYDDFTTGLDGLKAGSSIPKSGQERFALQAIIGKMNLFAGSRLGAELRTKRSISGGYVPFGREGSYQIRIELQDPKTGQVFKIAEEQRKDLLFMQVATEADAKQMAEEINAVFADESADSLYEFSAYENGEYKTRRLKMVAMAETARTTDNATSETNLHDVIRTLTRFGINITPNERRRLFQGLTRQDSKARRQLNRRDVRGYDPNTIKYVSQHLESSASSVARRENRPIIDKLFTDGDKESEQLWRGDEVEYQRRKTAWEEAQKDSTMDPALKASIKQEYIDYEYTFKKNNSKFMANKYKDRARQLLGFLDAQTEVEFSDFGSGDFGSKLRMWTTIAQLGGSLAVGLLNVVSLVTNVTPSLSGFNQKNGFGGGFGWARSSTTLSHALWQTKNPAQSDVKFWDDLLADPAKLKASGFTAAEAQFMQQEVSSGSMQAALFNALLGSARGRVTSGAAQKATQTFMGAFTYTEQATRRASGLAAFRLKYAQAQQEGKARKLAGAELDRFAFDKASQFAVSMLDSTLGEYAMFARPAMFRGGVGQFIYLYKTFPINTVLMLASMDKKTALLAMGLLMVFSGMKGLPFADDLMDLLDTIAQLLGWGPGSVWRGTAETTALDFLNSVAPGMTPVIWRGVLNNVTPANVADRVSLSNMIPGTGIALAGANVGREILEVAGPMASFIEQTIASTTGVAKYALETVGLRDDTTSLTGIARAFPVTMVRALGDIAAYSQSGAIVNQRGYVVSEDMHMGTLLTRAVGFYPASAVRENDVVRAATRLGNYQREVSSVFRQQYVSARIAGDTERAREVVDMVDEWNKSAKGTGLAVPNFVMNANRALREARRTGSERLKQSASRDAQGRLEELQYLYGIED
jgi:hypothetical protein